MEPPTFTRPGTGNRTLSLLDDESEKEARFCEWAKQDIEDLYTLCTIYKIESGPHQFILDTASDGFNAPNPAEAIRKQYAIAKNDKWAAVYRDAYRYHETQGELEDWHATIMDLRRK